MSAPWAYYLFKALDARQVLLPLSHPLLKFLPQKKSLKNQDYVEHFYNCPELPVVLLLICVCVFVPAEDKIGNTNKLKKNTLKVIICTKDK